MTKEHWRSTLRRVERRLRTENGVRIDEDSAFVDDCAKLDAALRDGVLVEARRQSATAHEQCRERLLDHVQIAEPVRNDGPFTTNKTIGGCFAMMYQHRILTAAAAVAITACALLSPSLLKQTVNANAVYAQMLENIHGITFQYEAHEKTGPVESVTKLYSGGDGLERTEFIAMDISFVMIFRDSMVYYFDPLRQKVRISPAVRAAASGERFLNNMDSFLESESAEALGLQEFDGVECYVYRYEWIKDKPETPRSESSIIEIAVDAETSYPHRIAYHEYRHDPTTKAPLGERFEAVVITNFEWNIELDQELFDTSIPEGWTVETVETVEKPKQ